MRSRNVWYYWGITSLLPGRGGNHIPCRQRYRRAAYRRRRGVVQGALLWVRVGTVLLREGVEAVITAILSGGAGADPVFAVAGLAGEAALDVRATIVQLFVVAAAAVIAVVMRRLPPCRRRAYPWRRKAPSLFVIVAITGFCAFWTPWRQPCRCSCRRSMRARRTQRSSSTSGTCISLGVANDNSIDVLLALFFSRRRCRSS